MKRRYFTEKRDQLIEGFSLAWFVSEGELQSSALQYVIGMEPIPNVSSIIESRDFGRYQDAHTSVKPFQYPQAMKRAWRKLLDEAVIYLEDELR